MSVIDEIADERQRQIDVEGWTLDHDKQHTDRSLVRAAVAEIERLDRMTETAQ